jgi:hypothetical protein
MSNIKLCEDTFCKIYTKKIIKSIKDIFKKEIENIKIKMKNEKSAKTKENLKFSLNFLLNCKKSINTNKSFHKECKKIYCNPSCKETIFENGNFLKYSKEIEKKYSEEKLSHSGKLERNLIKKFKKLRKEIFKDKNSVLKNSFYNGLKKETINKLKKKGAISGCTLTYEF